MKIIGAMAITLVLLTSNPVFAYDWPQYLGPNRDATSNEKGLMRSWPVDGPKLLWTIPLGEGFGGPAISEGKVYVYDRVENKTDILRCVDLITGKEEWTFTYEAPGSVDHNGSRSVPTINGNRIYICDPFGNLHCIDKPTPAGFKMLSKAKLLDSKEEFAPLALSDGKLVIRDEKQMKCFQVK